MPRPLIFLAAVFTALGLAWIGLEFGEIAHYGDTREYLHLATTLEVDAYRGVLYPAFLAALASLPAAEGILTPSADAWHVGGPCDFPPAIVLVQIAQLLFACLAWAAYLHVFGGTKKSRWALAGILFLVLCDPLVAHFNMSIMSDGLALSGTALFCAALGAWRTRRWPGWLALGVLALAFFVTGGLRSEKKHVLAVVAVATPCVWWWLDRGAAGRATTLRSFAPALCGVLGFLAVAGLQQAFHSDQGRWPLRTTILHQRVAFPNFVATYADQPAHVRRLFLPQWAEYFDEHHRNGRDLLDRATRGNAAMRDKVIEDMARVAWAERWPFIVGDVLRDATENVFATPSFYTRLATHALVDEDRFREIFYSDGTRWTYTRLEEHHPRTARIYLGAAAAVFVGALLAALMRWRRAARKLPTREQLALATPVLVLIVVNAAAFAMTQDLVHIRYAVFSHVALLAWLYSSSVPPK